MKQIQFESFGPPSLVAKCVEVADVGAPSAWEVVVDIAAFPINVADLAMLAGRYGTLPKLPSTIGMEASGTVAAVGSAVKDIQPGDRVVVLGNNNWAERRKLAVGAVHKVPGDCDLKQMAMLKVNPTTAQLLLTQFTTLSANDWVLQNAPLSSVGRCVIQIAKASGYRTINIVRRAETAAEVLALGGSHVIQDGADLADQVRAVVRHDPIKLGLDAVAGPGVQRMAECLSDGGLIVNYGMLSNERCVLGPEQTIFRGISLQGFWLSKLLNRLSLVERKSLFDGIADKIVAGQLSVPIDSCFAIQDISAAIQRAEQNGRSGKVLVECSS